MALSSKRMMTHAQVRLDMPFLEFNDHPRVYRQTGLIAPHEMAWSVESFNRIGDATNILIQRRAEKSLETLYEMNEKVVAYENPRE